MIFEDGKPAPRFPRLKGRLPPALARCPGCGLHLFPSAKQCPHCGGDLAALARQQARAVARAEKALATLERLFSGARAPRPRRGKSRRSRAARAPAR